MITRQQIIDEAMSWIGTRYMNQHSVKGAGCDCLGLIRGVWREVIGPEPEQPPAYSPSWAEVGDEEYMLDAAARHMRRVSVAQPGDVMVFRMRRNMVAKHCAIRVSETHMIHAYQGVGRVECSPMVGYWSRRLVASFEYPGVI